MSEVTLDVVTGTVAEVYDIVAKAANGEHHCRYRAQIDGTDIKAEVCGPGLGMQSAVNAVLREFKSRFEISCAAAIRMRGSKFFYIRYIRPDCAETVSFQPLNSHTTTNVHDRRD